VSVEGSAHLFILPADEHRNEHIASVKAYLSKNLSDKLWLAEDKEDIETADLKMLMIEHRMAATRLKFPNLYSAFKDSGHGSLSTAFSEGNSWPLKPFVSFVLPLVEAYNQGNNFQTIELLRKFCPKLTTTFFADNVNKPSLVFKKLKVEVAELATLLSDGSSETIGAVVTYLKSTGLYTFDERYQAFLTETSSISDTEQEIETNNIILHSMHSCRAAELWGYRTYINDESPYSTQHSVKGAEFERVMVILDDEEGKKSTQFSYEKLFGVKELSKTDQENIAAGKETVVDRTRRLLYVCCSRAKTDLAVLFFVADVDSAYQQVKSGGLFRQEDVLRLEELR